MMLFSNSQFSLPGAAISRASWHQYYPPLFCFGKSKRRVVSFFDTRPIPFGAQTQPKSIGTQINPGSLYRLPWF
jgi:hypothetical protein